MTNRVESKSKLKSWKEKDLRKSYIVGGSFCPTYFIEVKSHVSLVLIGKRTLIEDKHHFKGGREGFKGDSEAVSRPSEAAWRASELAFIGPGKGFKGAERHRQ